MAEKIFPVVGLPISLLLIAIGGVMLWDILSAYGMSKGPDLLARQNPILAWLVDQGRLGQSVRPSSKALILRRLLIAWTIGIGMLIFWAREVFG